jgi:translation initiation factor IF-2
MKRSEAISSEKTRPKLEIVLKCDSIGSLDAMTTALSHIAMPEIDTSIIHSGVGSVSKSDVLLAETAGRLIVGFQVDALPGMDKVVREHGVEVRLFNVIYALTSDISSIAESLVPAPPEEQIIGTAKVIALFKSSRRAEIIGCEVLGGHLAVGQHYRLISAMGPVHIGTIESIHIGQTAVQKATPGQQVGIKIRDFTQAKIGDLVESFRSLPKKTRPWEPTGQIIRK